MTTTTPAGWPVVSMHKTFAKLTTPGAAFELEEIEAHGRRVRAFKHAYPSLRAVFEASRHWDDRDFLVLEDERLSYRAHRLAVTALAHALRDRFGISRGNRVVIAMRNLPEWSVAFWATTAIGAISVPLNAWGSGVELAYGIEDSGASLALFDGERFARLRGQGELPRTCPILLVRPGEVDPSGTIALSDLIGAVGDYANLDERELPSVDIAPEDDATLFYTSGTTGRPKGAVGTHRNIATNLVSRAFSAARAAVRRGDAPPPLVPGPDAPQRALLLPVPLFHVTGCHSMLVATFASGGKVVMMRRWNAETALTLIEAERINSLGGVPGMIAQLLDSPSFAQHDLSSVDAISYGGAASGAELMRRVNQAFPGASTGNGYGMTETSSIATHNTAEDHTARPDSVGALIPPCDARLVGEDGKDAPKGGTGELWIRGPNVVRGYWQRPEETAESFPDGWVRTGDIARIDAEGFVYILDRLKDVVIRGGENIYCVEVEEALMSHEAVIEAAVFGIPHKILGEELAAAIHLAPNTSATPDELRSYVANQLAQFKVPARIDIHAEPLPRNASGKVLKSELRAGPGNEGGGIGDKATT
jgi:long-chain acyl-CoA synthetase